MKFGLYSSTTTLFKWSSCIHDGSDLIVYDKIRELHTIARRPGVIVYQNFQTAQLINHLLLTEKGIRQRLYSEDKVLQLKLSAKYFHTGASTCLVPPIARRPDIATSPTHQLQINKILSRQAGWES